MDWAISLILNNNRDIDSKIKNFLDFFLFPNISYEYFLEDLEATGPLGNELSDKIEQGVKDLRMNKSELVQLLEEDGQLIEFELHVKLDVRDQFIIIVRDGDILDILGTGPRPSELQVGPYRDMDINLFLPLD